MGRIAARAEQRGHWINKSRAVKGAVKELMCSVQNCFSE